MNIRAGRPTAGVTAATLREMNIRTVWSVIEGGHPISRAEIARLTGISKPTVSVLLEELLATGLVTQSPDEARGPSHGAVFFGPKSDGVHALALDLGAHHLRGVLAGPGAAIAARRDVDVAGRDAPRMVAAAAGLAAELIAAAGVDPATVRHAVAGVPGVVDRHTGRVWQALNIPALNGYAIATELQAALGVPLTVENDIDLAALGEHTHGTGAAAESFAFLSVGTGVGAGLVLHGYLHRGHSGAAGELDNAFDAEAFAANDPCAAAILEFAAPHAAELAGDGKALTTELIFDRARAGHPAAITIVDEVARRIGAYISVLAAVADVELVILGGGIGLNGDLSWTASRTDYRNGCPTRRAWRYQHSATARY
jgi:predicted NBD/HSP70 family sugar kinase